MVSLHCVEIFFQNKVMEWSFEEEMDLRSIKQEHQGELSTDRLDNSDHVIIDSRFLSGCTGAVPMYCHTKPIGQHYIFHFSARQEI